MKTKSVDIVTGISKEAFQRNYLRPQKPVLIRGLVDEAPAGEKWTLDYIKEVCGEVTVDVFDNKNPNNATAFTTPDLKMKFRDYVNNITREEPSSLRMFLFNMFKVKPELRKDFPCPRIIKGIMGRVGFMFFGAKGIKVRIHQDMDFSNVLLTQFYGRKRVVLVPPEYSRLLYKLPLNTHSLIDLDNPDYKKYPGLKYLQAYECVLEPGDSIFMPSGYWHYITYLDGGFSVSYRKMASGLHNKLQGLLHLAVYMPIDKLLHRVVGEKWLDMKEKLADHWANKAIERLQKHTPPMYGSPRAAVG